MTTLAIRGLQPAQMKALDRQARHLGKTTSELVRSLIERELMLADKSFDDVLRPIREGFRKSGVTENEFDRLVKDARRAIHKKRRPGRRG